MEAITARIYRINAPNIGKAYYGSTTRTLAYRMSTHKGNMNTLNRGNHQFKCSSFDILTDPDVYIEELEVVVGTKAEIAVRERWWIDNNPCVNIRRPGRTDAESKRDRRKLAGTVNCECGGKHYNTTDGFNKHIESRKHNDHVHARQVEYFKNKAVS